MTSEQMKKRTKEFAKSIIAVCRKIPNTREGNLINNQLFRAGTSVGANYRAACRGRSKAEFISKIGIVLEEADECLYWMELLTETNIMEYKVLDQVMKEANELVAIFVSSINTAKKRKL